MRDLSFEVQNGNYVCKLAADENKGIVHVDLGQTAQAVAVSANLAGMPPSTVKVFQNPYEGSVVFEVDFPLGVEVTISTLKAPVKAVWKESE